MAVNDTQFGDMVLEHLQRLEKNPHRVAEIRGCLFNGDTLVERVQLAGHRCPRDDECRGSWHPQQEGQASSFSRGRLCLYIEQDQWGSRKPLHRSFRYTRWAGICRLAAKQALSSSWWYEQPSGEEKFLALLGAGTGRITPPTLLRLLLVLGTGWLACWLVIPLLLWPANSTAHHGRRQIWCGDIAHPTPDCAEHQRSPAGAVGYDNRQSKYAPAPAPVYRRTRLLLYRHVCRRWSRPPIGLHAPPADDGPPGWIACVALPAVWLLGCTHYPHQPPAHVCRPRLHNVSTPGAVYLCASRPSHRRFFASQPRDAGESLYGHPPCGFGGLVAMGNQAPSATPTAL